MTSARGDLRGATSIWTDVTECRSCSSDALTAVIEFGSTPLADRLLRADQLDDPELRADLTLVVCEDCALAQIRETVDPEVLFFEEYPYFSSVSPSLMKHFGDSARAIIERFELDGDSFVVEAASNDGYMLKTFHEAGIRVQGIDPAKAPAQAAIDAGIPTIIDFWGQEFAERFVDEYGEADVFLGNNVMAHIPDLNGFVGGIATVLKDDGVAVLEFAYVADLVEHCEFDTIYHQHFYYHSVHALETLFARHGLFLNDVEHTAIHGGSLRVFVQPFEDRRPVVDEMLADERARGFDGLGAYRDFAARIETLRSDLRTIIDRVRADGGRIAGYAAAAKATTLMAYCGIDGDDLEYVCDLNEYKQGRFMGGNHLEIFPPSKLAEDRPDHVLILAWNFAEEIMAQNAHIADWGATFIVPVPEPRVVDPATRPD